VESADQKAPLTGLTLPRYESQSRKIEPLIQFPIQATQAIQGFRLMAKFHTHREPK
jgi:hypothetical protein